jgi:sucrose phosphorylase
VWLPRNTSRFHATGRWLRNQVQLITYVDRLSGDLKQLKEPLDREWSGLFGGVHLLPFFTPIDGADADFDSVDHTEVDRRLGDWEDVRARGKHLELVADLIVNHISSDFSQSRISLNAVPRDLSPKYF